MVARALQGAKWLATRLEGQRGKGRGHLHQSIKNNGLVKVAATPPSSFYLDFWTLKFAFDKLILNRKRSHLSQVSIQFDFQSVYSQV